MSRKTPHVQDRCRPGTSLTKAKITSPLLKQTGFKGSIAHSRKTKKKTKTKTLLFLLQ